MPYNVQQFDNLIVESENTRTTLRFMDEVGNRIF